MTPVRVAVVGIGWWGNVLADAARRAGGFHLVGGAARSADKRAAFVQKHGGRTYESCEAVLADPEVEGVIIATPHSVHAEQVVAAAAAGKHVFVDKPFTLTAADGRRATEACRRAGVVLAVGHQRRRQAASRALKRFLDEGTLGRVAQVEGNMSADAGFTKHGGTTMMMKCRFLAAAVLIAALAAMPVAAQEFPAKPVELVLPFGPGGSHDLTARAVASVAHQYLGQPLLVVLKPGGGGAVGSQQVIRAKPDGYTLLFGGTGPNTTFALVQKAPVGPDHFVPVARINHSPAVFAVRSDAPWKSLREAIDHAKKNPGTFSFANTGPWGAADLPMRLIAAAAGIDYNNIPHDGGGPALLAVLGGHANATFGFAPQLLPQISAGKMRALAVTGTKRLASMPNVPTVREEGYDVTFTMWRAALAPRGTPPPIVEKLESVFKKISEDRSFVALIKQLGDEVDFQGSKEFGATWRQEWDAIGKVAAGAQR